MDEPAFRDASDAARRSGTLTGFRFLHAADLHLDTPFEGIRELAPFVADALADASLAALDNLVSHAVEASAAFVLFAGDIYDGPERGVRAQLRFKRALVELATHGIASFVVYGNHDPLAAAEGGSGSRWSAISSLPPEVTVFPAGTPVTVPVRSGGEVVATVQGVSYAERETSENLARRFRRPAAGPFHVGLLHCNVGGDSTGHANYSPCTLDDLRAAGLDYWALGHVHKRQVLSGRASSRSEPFVVYPGNTQGRSLKASERGPKGATLVEVVGGTVVGCGLVECDSVRFEEVELDVAEVEGIDEICDHLAASARERLALAGGRSVVLRARLTGRSGAHDELRRAGALSGLTRDLRDTAGEAEPFAWWECVVDETATAYDAGAVRRRGGFGADLLWLADELELDASRGGGKLARLGDELLARPPQLPLPLRRAAEALAARPGEIERLLAAGVGRALDLLEAER
jgi:DNA repair exonuclease SbcCD nuclease subunit